jgi:hypothetical protein
VTYEPTWSMPLPNWQPTGSFLEAATPPAQGPADGTLVQLPCINQDWLPLVLGALDQLRNPSTWLDTLTPAALESVLGQVNYLRSIIAKSLPVPCVNPVVGAHFDCTGLYLTFADGSTALVSGWTANFCNCVNGCIIPPVPSNPIPAPVNQAACNIAAYLAVGVLQATVDIAQGILNILDNVEQFAHELANQLTSAFPLVAVINDAIDEFWKLYVAGVRSDFTSAAADTALWALVTCAIYNAIKNQGYVDGANLPTIRANICAISYVHADVINALCAFVNHLPLLAWQIMQSVTALVDADCTDCGTFCHFFDFKVGQQGWFPNGGVPAATWSSGVGWTATGPSSGREWLELALNFPHAVPVTSVCLRGSVPWAAAGAGRQINMYLGGSLVHTGPLPIGDSGGTPTPWCIGSAALLTDQVLVILDSAQGGGNPPHAVVDSFEITGDGPDPFGVPGCQY